MKLLTSTEKITILLAIGLFSSSLSGCGLNGETLDIWSSSVHSSYVTTVPEGAKMTLMSIDSGVAAGTSTAYSPNRVYFTQNPSFGTYLAINYDGYEEKVIRLDPEKKRIHVRLKPCMKGCQQKVNDAWTIRQGVTSPINMSGRHVADVYTSMTDWVNFSLDQAAAAQPHIDTVVNSIDLEYSPPAAKPNTGKIHITSIPSGAKLLLDGNLMGTTPQEILAVSAGDHNLTLRKKEFKEWTGRITLHREREKRIEVFMSAFSYDRKPKVKLTQNRNSTNTTPRN